MHTAPTMLTELTAQPRADGLHRVDSRANSEAGCYSNVTMSVRWNGVIDCPRRVRAAQRGGCEPTNAALKIMRDKCLKKEARWPSDNNAHGGGATYVSAQVDSTPGYLHTGISVCCYWNVQQVKHSLFTTLQSSRCGWGAHYNVITDNRRPITPESLENFIFLNLYKPIELTTPENTSIPATA